MSLLLDALKRAEDAKRAKAEAAAVSQLGPEDSARELGEPGKVPSDSGPDLPLTDTGPTSIIAPITAHGSPSPPEIPVLSLEVIDEAPGLVTKPVVDPAADDKPPARRSGDSPIPAMSLEELLDSELGVDRRKPEVVPLTPAATAAFRAARLQSSPPPPVLPTPLSASPSLSMTSIEPMTSSAMPTNVSPPPLLETPQQASNREAIKNAFAVKQAAQPSAKSKWVLPLVGFVIAAVGAGSWYVWNEMNRFNKPSVARLPAIPAAAAPAPSSTPAPTLTTGPSAASASTGPGTAQGTKSDEPATDAKAGASKAEVAELPPLLPPPATQLKEERAITAPKIVSATPREAFARRIEALPAANSSASPDKVVLKAATPITPQINPSLSAGYTALAAGDYATAKRRYAEAISSNNNSADAHLGFATAAARSGGAGDLDLAVRHYQRVLEIDPRNSTARAALIVLAGGQSVDGSSPPAAAAKEAELKLLIAQDPSAANAHFLLGSLYADARRWRDAQQAFFEAAKLVPQNADYSYNLAVSLDNLGQSAAAANFYRRALVATTKGQFDIPTVERRIAQLTAATKDVPAKR